MAKYEINYKCGHTGTTQLCGKHTERERKIEWMEQTLLCPNCYKIELASDRAKATAKATDKNKSNGLPELTGSPKQIAWAETIRANKIEEIEKMIPENAPEEKKIMLSQYLNPVYQEISSHKWIEERDKTGYSIMQDICGQILKDHPEMKIKK